ncbi:MBL fold metallo-hydrolase [Thermus thermamylovorans]|uniref:MBL fold metallo-hydrolase n=1 Tax=Thermus thermamylovorans TaxID=2509362 RepID=A0A4Q9B8B5_9DEIN|nr:MBL fold metallo-hydrolase [Thermus thermamylovorans]TBH21453.1 MBL fold metallo-hydrolase [Thermus thermamylovorans]
MVRVLDLRFQGAERVIASFLLDSREGPVLIETGPESTYPRLVEALREEGVAPEEVRHVFVTHIHLDHAGAAWRLAEGGATVYVHPRGAPHLLDPSRLLASAERIYGPMLRPLWGELRGVPEERVRVLGDGEVVDLGGLRVQALETLGHASHHHAYLVDGALFAGDIAGVRIAPGPVLPPTPPPDIHLESWYASLDRVLALRPEALYLTHFGAYRDVEAHLLALRQALEDWAGWTLSRLKEGLSPEALTPRFEAYWREGLLRAGVDEAGVHLYELADPPFMNLQGLVRYWQKHHPEALA